MKTLIINGSPRVNGNTAALIAELKKHISGEVIELSAFRSDIAPCTDCRACCPSATGWRESLPSFNGDGGGLKVWKVPIVETARFRTRRKNPRFQNEFKLNPSEWRVSRFALANTIRRSGGSWARH